MCGICGIWGNTDRQAVNAMVDAMHHRGPDDCGVYHDGAVTLGMARLSIIDLSMTGHQPMCTPDKLIWIVYNGELYNFQSERSLLESLGYSFNSTSDTEVVLRMYEHYGDDFLLRMRGMFALAIYDKRRGEEREKLLLARDHLGIKPLLYTHSGAQFIFASEMKALLASRLIEPEIDPVALRLLLTFGSVYQPRTMLKGVYMLLPAHRLIVEHGQERVERYWSLGVDRYPDLTNYTYAQAVAEMTEALMESVRLQMVSDVPLGAFLSSGVDSSILVALMTRVASHRVKTFSIGFESEGERIDESIDARRIADFLGTDHNHVIVKGTDVRDRIQHIACSLDQPSVNGVNTYFVSLAASKAVTVAISGTGGDELFAGYPWFANMVLHQQRRRKDPLKTGTISLLANIAKQQIFNSFLLKRGGNRLNTLRMQANFLSLYASNYQIYDQMGTARLLSEGLRKPAQAGRAPRLELIRIDELPDGSVIERVTGLCLRGYTSNQLLRDIDAMSMTHSLEVRVPYLDPVIADMALSLPDIAKLGDLTHLTSLSENASYRDTGAKRILIDVARQFLPENFDMQPKRGFGMPFDAWLKGPLREVLLETTSVENVGMRGLFNSEEVSAVIKRFLDGGLAWPQPWLLMMIELWCREVLDGNFFHRTVPMNQSVTLS
jgi:asparagine synthase (glutamine-hydrolysing)